MYNPLHFYHLNENYKYGLFSEITILLTHSIDSLNKLYCLNAFLETTLFYKHIINIMFY